MNEKIKLGSMTVKDIRNMLVQFPSVAKETDSIKVLIEKMLEDTRTRCVYVVGDAGELVGTVRMNTLVQYLFPVASIINMGSYENVLTQGFVSFGANTVGNVMNRQPVCVTEDALLSDMAVILMEQKLNELPVVDGNNVLIGEVNMYEVMQAFLNTADGWRS